MPRFDPRQLNRAGIFSRSLLRQPTPRGLFGPNIQQGGVGLGPGRNTLIAGPNAAATKAMGSAINRFNPPGVPLPTSPRVMNTGGAKVSDIFKGARLDKLSPDQIPGQSAINTGRYPGISAPPIPMPGMPPTTMQGMTSLATAGARRLAGQEPANQVPSDVGDGPQGFMDKVGGFFKRPGVGQSMMAAGARMMQGSPEGTFATIGHGLETGLGKYEELKGSRREQLDWEEDERRRKEVNAGVEAAIRERRDADGNITRRALTEEEAAMVRGAGGAEGVALAASLRQGTRARTAIDTFSLGADDEYLALLRAQPDDIALAAVTDYAKTEKAKAGRVRHLVKMGYSQEVAEVAAEDAAGAQAVLNRGMETTIMRDGSGVLRIFHDGEFVGSAGEGAPEITAAEAENLAAARETLLWAQSEGARAKVRDEHTRLTDSIEAIPNLVETVEAINTAPPEYFDATGKLKLHIDHWLGLDDRILGQKVDQMLTAFGILNLDAFTGAISDRELVVALANAGAVGKPVEMINAILARSINNTINAAIRQNVRTKEMDDMLATTTVAKAAVGTGQAGLWTNSFGFDMGTEGTLNEETGLYEGGTGLLGYRARADQAMMDELDAAIEEAGGEILVNPDELSGGRIGLDQPPPRNRLKRDITIR